MSKGQSSQQLKFSRTFPVPRERVFRAWTEPEELRKWWLLGQGWRLNIVEVDLRVGGRYRIGLVSQDSSLEHEVNGTFRSVSRPEKLVYTWNGKGPEDHESVVTVEFLDRGQDQTELVLTHERVDSQEYRQTHAGWVTVLESLNRLLAITPKHT